MLLPVDPLTLFRTVTPLAFSVPEVAMKLLFKPPAPPSFSHVITPPEFRQYTPFAQYEPYSNAWWSQRPVPFGTTQASPELSPDRITGKQWPSTRNARVETKQRPSQPARQTETPPPAQQQPPPEQPPPPAQMPAPPQDSGITPLEIAVYRYSEGDKELARAMLMGALMEGGNLTGPWNSGDNGQSHGPYQIYQGAHAGLITPEESNDPDIATRFMLPKYKAALASLRREQPELFKTNPYLAAAIVAYRAERPAAMYPVNRQQWARSVLEKRFRE